MVEGREESVLTGEATQYRLVIERSHDDRQEFLIKPECWSDTFLFPPSQKIIAFARSVERGRVPAALRTKRKRPVLYEALFSALEASNRKAAGEALKAAIEEDTFGRRNAVAEARRLVRQSIDAFNAEDVHFLFTDHGWRLTSVDKNREKLLFLVPFATFGDPLFDRVADEGAAMTVSGPICWNTFTSSTPLPQRRAWTSLGDYPIESVAWDLELDVTEGAIDWFEIRPEIRCNGRVIPRDLWEQALARKGVIVRDGAIQILDEKSMLALSALASLWSGTAARAGARTVTSIPRLRIIDLFLLKKQGVAVKLTAEDEALMQRLTEFRQVRNGTIAPQVSGGLRSTRKKASTGSLFSTNTDLAPVWPTIWGWGRLCRRSRCWRLSRKA